MKSFYFHHNKPEINYRKSIGSNCPKYVIAKVKLNIQRMVEWGPTYGYASRSGNAFSGLRLDTLALSLTLRSVQLKNDTIHATVSPWLYTFVYG